MYSLSADKKDILLALIQIKMLLADKKYRFIPRRKNLDALAELGLMPANIIDIINDLTYKDYCSGPEDDRDYGDPKSIWIFGKYIEEDEIYIKLKLTINEVVNISFHKAEYPLNYPYKDS